MKFENKDQVLGAIRYAISTEWVDSMVKEKCPVATGIEVSTLTDPGVLITIMWASKVGDGEVKQFGKNEFAFPYTCDAKGLQHHMDETYNMFHSQELIIENTPI